MHFPSLLALHACNHWRYGSSLIFAYYAANCLALLIGLLHAALRCSLACVCHAVRRCFFDKNYVSNGSFGVIFDLSIIDGGASLSLTRYYFV